MEQPPREFPPDVNVGPAYDDALRAMVDRVYLKSQNLQEQQMRAVRHGLHPWLVEFEKGFLRRMAGIGVPMYVHTAVRSAEQQAIEFAEGNSKLRDGPHMHGCALDIVHGVKQWGLTRKQWDLIGHVGEEFCKQRGLDLEWGGRWRDPWDPAHWQVKGWRGVASGFPFKVPPYRG